MRFSDISRPAMEAVSRAFDWFRGTAATGKATVLELVEGWQYYKAPAPNTLTLLKLYNDNPWTRSIVQRVSRSVARQRWHVKDDAGEPVYDHPFLAFLNAGTEGLPGVSARALTQTYLDLVGEAFWVLDRDASGAPKGYAVIPPSWVNNIPARDAPYYEIQPRVGGYYKVPAEDVLYFRDPDVTDPYNRGRGFVGALTTELETDETAATFIKSYLENRARPDLIISGTAEAPLNEKDRAALAVAINERHRGAKKAGKPLISGGKLEITEIGSTLRDNDMSKLRAESRAIITEVFGVPPEIFGRLDNSNRATIDSAQYLYGLHTVDPRLAFLLERLDVFAQVEFGVQPGRLGYDSPIAEDKAFKLDVFKSGPSHFTRNEVRAMAGLPPVPGGDELPERQEPPGPGGDDEDEPGKGDGTPPPPAKGKSIKGQVWKTLTPEEVIRVSAAPSDPQVVATITKLIEKVYSDLVSRYGAELLRQLGREADALIGVNIANWIMERVPWMLEGINRTTTDRLRSAILEGVASNEAIDQLLDRIDDVFAEAADVRSAMIAQTEATALTGFSSLEAARFAGFKEKKWISSGDHKVRGSHQSLDQQIQPVEMPFKSPKGNTAMHPGGFGVPSEDIHCRCAMMPIAPIENKSFVSPENNHSNSANEGLPEGETKDCISKSGGFSEAQFQSFHNEMLDKASGIIGEHVKDMFATQREKAKDLLRVAMGS